MTSDKKLLEIIEGCHLEFVDNQYPVQTSKSYAQKFNATESEIIDHEVQKLVNMNVVKEVQPTESDIGFISPIFTRPKKNGTFRVILNLKELNKHIVYHHFKMDNFESAVNLVSPGCFFGSVDFTNAYYSVPLAECDQKFLRFMWRNKVYQYTCMPQELASAPRIFTKLLKPVFATLRRLGVAIVGYIDDSLLVGQSAEECQSSIHETINLSESLGFVINYEKSLLVPSRQVTFLGNVIDSETMTVTLTQQRKSDIHDACNTLRKKKFAKIREVARIIGLIVASFSAVEYGPLHYRNLEREKTEALRQSSGNFDDNMSISSGMKKELDWWVQNVVNSTRNISRSPYDFSVMSDASLEGWGAVSNLVKAGGRWTQSESQNHINYLELLACFFALKSFCTDKTDLHVKMFMDNQTAIAYVNNMGGITSEKCDLLANTIWSWCIQRNIWITACYVPGKENRTADRMSRKFDDQIEWMLNKSVFNQIENKWGTPTLDLFASRLNKQVSEYCSYTPDPDAKYVNAFSISWTDIYGYINPPFSLISRCMMKIRQDEGECILVAPVWPTQPWFTKVMELLIDLPVILPMTDNLLVQPCRNIQHPLKDSLVMMACRLSGLSSRNEDFLNRQPRSCWHHGSPEPRNNIRHFMRDGFSTVVKRRLIHFVHL